MTAYISGTFRIPLHPFPHGWPTFTRDSIQVRNKDYRQCVYEKKVEIQMSENIMI